MFGFSTVIPEFWKEVANILDSGDRFGRMVIWQTVPSFQAGANCKILALLLERGFLLIDLYPTIFISN